MNITYRDYQRKGIDLSHTRSHFAFGWKPGLGKTILACGICAERPMPSVVLAPKSILHCAWENDIAKFPSIRSIVVHEGSAAARSKQIQRADWDVAITTYEMFRKHRLDYLSAGVCRLIVDESSKCRNPEAKIVKDLTPFADKMREVYTLSGTMAPNNFTEYYSQLRLVNQRLKYQGYWKWCYAYGYPVKRMIIVKGQTKSVIAEWKQTPAQEAALREHLAEHVWFLRKEDCLDLPDTDKIVIPVELSKEETEVYLGVRESLCLMVGSEQKSVKGQAVLMKLRQITGGKTKDTGDFGTSKLDALDELLTEIGRDEPVVIWAEFTHEIDAIRELCKKRGESCMLIDGRTSGAAGWTAGAFQEGKIQRLVCHPAAAGHGITLTRAAYCIYFSMSFSAEQYEQSQNRIHRMGQTRSCTYYHLVAELHGRKGEEAMTVDQSCYNVSSRKMDASAAIEIEVERGRSTQ